MSWGLKVRNVKKVCEVYENIERQTFRKADADIYGGIGTDMGMKVDKLGLSLEQTGGAGMLGETITIVGDGAALGISVGAGVGGAVSSVGLMGKKNTIIQSAKLLTSVSEIFLNDEHDIEFSNSVYEQYLQNITNTEERLAELRLKKDVAKGKEKKAIAETIKKAEKSVEAMKVARKSMLKYNSSFAEGLKTQQYLYE